MMGGSTLEAMADGVDQASVVLICASEGYKLSPNARAGIIGSNYMCICVGIRSYKGH